MLKTFDEIIKEQYKIKGIGYRLFFTGLMLEKFLFYYDNVNKAKERAELLSKYYFLMRYLDDIIDGDINFGNNSILERISFLEKKKLVLMNLKVEDEIDLMLYECLSLADKLGFSLETESKLIIDSLIFDGYRLKEYNDFGRYKIETSKDLQKHFYDLDIVGTIKGCLKIFNEDVTNISLLEPLGYCSRKYYDTRDFIKDVKSGLINVSFEEMLEFGITDMDLQKLSKLGDREIDLCAKKGYNCELLSLEIPQSILSYLDFEMNKIKDKMSVYEKIIDNENLRNTTKLTLQYGYVFPINRYLKKIGKQKIKR